jgi:ribosomal protein S27E
MRLIDADEISKKAAELSRVYCRMYRQTKDNVWASRSDAVDHVMEMIYEAPTIEVEPVKQGRWNPIETTGIYFIKVECSTCDALIEYIEPRADNYIICPWCGSINGR